MCAVDRLVTQEKGCGREQRVHEWNTHVLVVLQGRSLEDELPCLPAAEVISELSKVPLLVASLYYRLLRLLHDVRSEECDDFGLLHYRKCNHGFEVHTLRGWPVWDTNRPCQSSVFFMED